MGGLLLGTKDEFCVYLYMNGNHPLIGISKLDTVKFVESEYLLKILNILDVKQEAINQLNEMVSFNNPDITDEIIIPYSILSEEKLNKLYGTVLEKDYLSFLNDNENYVMDLF